MVGITFLVVMGLGPQSSEAQVSSSFPYPPPRYLPNPAAALDPPCGKPGEDINLQTSGWASQLAYTCTCIITIPSTGDTLTTQSPLGCSDNIGITIPSSLNPGDDYPVKIEFKSGGFVRQCIELTLHVSNDCGNGQDGGWPRFGTTKGVSIRTPPSPERAAYDIYYDPSLWKGMPYTSFIGQIQVVKVSARPPGGAYTDIKVSNLDPAFGYRDPYYEKYYCVDFNPAERNIWYNGNATSNNSGVQDPADVGYGGGGYFESGPGQSSPPSMVSHMIDSPELTDAMANHGYDAVKAEFEVGVYIGDGPKAGTPVGHLKYTLERELGQSMKGPYDVTGSGDPPSPEFEAAMQKALRDHFTPHKGFKWPKPTAPRWGYKRVPCQ